MAKVYESVKEDILRLMIKQVWALVKEDKTCAAKEVNIRNRLSSV